MFRPINLLQTTYVLVVLCCLLLFLIYETDQELDRKNGKYPAPVVRVEDPEENAMKCFSSMEKIENYDEDSFLFATCVMMEVWPGFYG